MYLKISTHGCVLTSKLRATLIQARPETWQEGLTSSPKIFSGSKVDPSSNLSLLGVGSPLSSSASHSFHFLAMTIGTVLGNASLASPIRKFWLPGCITTTLDPKASWPVRAPPPSSAPTSSSMSMSASVGGRSLGRACASARSRSFAFVAMRFLRSSCWRRSGRIWSSRLRYSLAVQRSVSQEDRCSTSPISRVPQIDATSTLCKDNLAPAPTLCESRDTYV